MALPVTTNNKTTKRKVISGIVVVGLGVGFAYVISRYVKKNNR